MKQKKDIAKTAWAMLKNKVYYTNDGMELNKKFSINVDEVEIEYVKENNKIYKQFNHRFSPNEEKKYVPFPESKEAFEAFDYFTEYDQKNNINHQHLKTVQSNSFIQSNYTNKSLFTKNAYHFSTAYYNSKKIASEKNFLDHEIEINTSIGKKFVKSIVYHNDVKSKEGNLQVTSFKDSEQYLTRVQEKGIDNIASPVIRFGNSAKFSYNDFEIQMDLYCIKEATYNDIIMMAKLHKSSEHTKKEADHIQVASKFTGHAILDKDGKMKFDDNNIPITKYESKKGKFVSMEGVDGNTVVLQLIAEKTQKLGTNDDAKLYFIPVNHPNIQKIFNVSETLSYIKDTLTKEPDVIDFIFRKYGLSSKEVAVDLIDAIQISNNNQGVFSVELDELHKNNPEFTNYVLKLIKESDVLDEKKTYSIEIDDKKDEFGEPIIHFSDLDYIEKIDKDLIGDNIGNDVDVI